MKTENKNTVKKLQLNKRTIVMLNEQSMNSLNGGTDSKKNCKTNDPDDEACKTGVWGTCASGVDCRTTQTKP